MADISLKIMSVTDLTPGIKQFELVSVDGQTLPAFEAGAHIDIETGNGLVRSYSLASDPADKKRYVLAILREAQGGGGSRWMHDEVKPGDIISASNPSNAFGLAPDANRHLLIAGGIGITPMLAMGHDLNRGKMPHHLHYCTKSTQQTAYLDEVAEIFANHVTYHHDGGDPARGIDLAQVLAKHEPGTHLYICGPAGLLSAARQAASHWPAQCVHYELFASARTAEEQAKIDDLPNEAFEIELAQSGQVFTVPKDKTILEILGENGIDIIKVCEEGYCGTCQVGLVGGQADHRDEVLDDDEKNANTLIQVCISRAMPGEKLILDL